MIRAALLAGVLVTTLAGCGADRDGPAPVAATTPSAPGSSAAPSPAVDPSAAPAAARTCPYTASPVPVPAGASADLSAKPVVAGSAAPPPSEVTVADIVVGDGAEATTLSAVEAKYVGALSTTGVEFDSSWKESPEATIPFTACAKGTITGFAIGPIGMKVGGRRQVTIPAELGYGEQGSPPTIPGGAALVFVIDLVKVTPPASG